MTSLGEIAAKAITDYNELEMIEKAAQAAIIEKVKADIGNMLSDTLWLTLKTEMDSLPFVPSEYLQQAKKNTSECVARANNANV
jgi:hypothetical protein